MTVWICRSRAGRGGVNFGGKERLASKGKPRLGTKNKIKERDQRRPMARFLVRREPAVVTVRCRPVVWSMRNEVTLYKWIGGRALKGQAKLQPANLRDLPRTGNWMVEARDGRYDTSCAPSRKCNEIVLPKGGVDMACQMRGQTRNNKQAKQCTRSRKSRTKLRPVQSEDWKLCLRNRTVQEQEQDQDQTRPDQQ